MRETERQTVKEMERQHIGTDRFKLPKAEN